MASPELLALDFDGVICDGLIEYFQTAWRAYCSLFKPKSDRPPDGLAEKFYPLRPIIETGWEMPVLVRSLVANEPSEKIVAQWPAMASRYLEAAGLEKSQSASTLDGVRDKWIEEDLQGWLSLHRFYPGIIEWLNRLLAKDFPIFIISTKEGRFIQSLLAQSDVDFPTERILGKEVKRPKYETIRLLKEQQSVSRIWFVEDRLPALNQVKQQNDLAEVQLFLADWGYNLESDRQSVRRSDRQDSRIRLLSLEQIVQPFNAWMR